MFYCRLMHAAQVTNNQKERTQYSSLKVITLTYLSDTFPIYEPVGPLKWHRSLSF